MATDSRRVIKTLGRPSAGVPRTLRELRLDRGWRLHHLATRADLNIAIVSQIERGRLTPTPDELADLSRALDGIPLAAALMVVHWEQQP